MARRGEGSMKKLILLRHAKAGWSDWPGRDIDRPLNDRGRSDAPLIGEWFANISAPDLALCSPATRARQTLDLAAPGLDAKFPDMLYGASAEEIIGEIRRSAGEAECVLVVGHNPGIGEAALFLLNQLPREADIERYPTAACAIIGFEIESWSELQRGSGELVAFMTPKRLR